jgi:SAM-dependent methyltransferase
MGLRLHKKVGFKPLMNDVEEITKCRLCESEKLTEYLNLGNAPLANCYSHDAPRFPLVVVKCQECGSHQLKHNVSQEQLFNENYAYSTPPSLASHFETFAGEVIRDLNLNDQSVIVDIGGNNGLLLSYFQQLTPNILNIEPSKNVAEESTNRGIPTICEFFNSEFPSPIVIGLDDHGYRKHTLGKADVIISSNVFAHSKEVLDMMKGVKNVLKKGSVFIQENAYWIDTLKNNDFCQVYNEHFFYHTISSLFQVYQNLGMTLYKVTFNRTSQMGSFRIFVKNYPKFPVEDSVRKAIENETLYMHKMNFESNYHNFQNKIDGIGAKLVKFLEEKKGQRVGLVGVPAKSALLVDYFKLENFIHAAYEDAPLKIGREVPGTRIQIKKMEELEECEVLLVGAYNFFRPLKERFKHLNKMWCCPIPYLTVDYSNGTGEAYL